MGGAYLSKPWRDIPESGYWKRNEYSEIKHENLGFMRSYHPQNKKATHVRILLHGPAGAGKSSFINSVDSVLQGRVADRVSAYAISAGSSFSKKYKTVKLRGAQGQYSFVLSDIMGFEKDSNDGIHVEDVKLALQGYVREGYEFVPGRPLTEDDLGYNPEPTLNDRVHVLVSVFPADTTEIMKDEVVKKMRAVRQAARDMGIPQVAIITKIDKACPKTQGDIKNAYWSKYLKQLADIVSMRLGLPLNTISLVKNYGSETRMDTETEVMILMALKQMIIVGEDYLNDLSDL